MNFPRPLRGFPAARRLLADVRVAAAWLVLLACSQGVAQTLDPRALPLNSVNTADPSEVFLKAYTSVQQAERLEQEGKRAPALAKYRFAASLLEQLTQTNPNWQTLIVRYRLRNTTETIRRLEEKGALQAATPAPATASRKPGASSAQPEDDLPVPEVNYGPPGTGSSDAIDQTIFDLKAKLARTQQELKGALDSLSTAQKEKKLALASAQKEKKEAAAAADKEKRELVKQRDEMAAQLQQARDEAQEAQKRFGRTKADRDSLQSQLTKVEDRLKDVSAKGPDAIQTRKELRNQISDLKRQLTRAQGDLDGIAKLRGDFDTRVAADEKRIAELTQQRDEAAAKVEMSQDAIHKIEELQTQNAGLTEKLTAAEQRIATLTEESARKREELAGMQQELTGLRDQLVSTRDQNDKSATTITELRQQLDEGAKKLEEMKSSGRTGEDFARMTKENELLRTIVMRQLKDQSRKMQARKLLNDELARLDVQSANLNAQVEELGRPSIQLTDEERALFKNPQVSISDTDTSTSMAVTIAKVGSGRGSDNATPAPAPGADLTTSDRNAQPDAVPDDHQPSRTSNRQTGAPKVVTGSQPLVSDELLPMAREALDAFSRGHYTDAEKTYSQLLARDPKNPYLLSNQGVVLFRQDKLKSAEVVLKKALAVTPKDPFCLATLGIVYYRMHRYDDALTYLTQAIQLDPRNATAHNYLGITSSQKGWPEAALAEIQKAIAINPNYADAHFNIAVIYATNSPPSKERAQEHYRIATSLGATPDPALEKMIQN